MFGKVRELVGAAQRTVSDHESTHPHTAGRVRQVVGGTLVADGLLGLENPLDGRRSRPGILAAVFLVVFGAVFVGAGTLISGSGADTDATTDGVITDVQRRFGNGKRTCSLSAEFTVGGQRYLADSRVSSGGNCGKSVGSPIEVRYNSADPTQAEVGAKPLWFGLLFVGVGVLIVLAGLVTFAVRAFCIVYGARLYLTGARMVKQHPAGPDDAGVVAEVRERLTTLIAGGRGVTWLRSATVAPPVVEATQPGWYPTADGAYWRWHDGTRWTENVAPRVPSRDPANPTG